MQLTRVGCPAIAQLTRVVWLEACGRELCDAGVAILAQMTQLTYLSLASNLKITDNAYMHLAALSRLQSLNISGTSMTWPCARFVYALPQLASLSIHGLKAKGSKATFAMPADICARLKFAGVPAPVPLVPVQPSAPRQPATPRLLSFAKRKAMQPSVSNQASWTLPAHT